MIEKILILSSLCIYTSGLIQGQDDSVEQLFTVKCGICHTIGKGKLIGPDLLNISEKRSEEWLLEYVRSSQSMIKKGDPDAIAIYEEYNELVMPDAMIPDEDIQSLLAFIADRSASGQFVGPDFVSILLDATPAHAAQGLSLFEGRTRFENGGPSCISCHNIQRREAMLKTNYAKDAMVSFENLGEAGVKSILENPPYPVMAEAYKGHDLTETETHDLLVYLRDAKAQTPNVELSSIYSNFLVFGVAGGVLLFVLYSMFWFNRKEDSVNQSIYRRQIKSTN